MRVFTAIIASSVFAFSAAAQTVREVDTLSPKDIDGHKLAFEVQLGADELAVFRTDVYEDGKHAHRYEYFQNKRDEKIVVHAVVLNLAFFSGLESDAGYLITIPDMGSRQLRGYWTMGHGFDGNGVGHYTFGPGPEAKGEKRFEFRFFKEKYAEAKRRVPDLPADTNPPQSWGWTTRVLPVQK